MEIQEIKELQGTQEIQVIEETVEVQEVTKNQKPKKNRKFQWKWKPKKKTVVILSLILVVTLAVGFLVVQSMRPQIPVVTVTALERQDLRNTVNVTGTVFSENVSEVYTPLTGYTVKSVSVEVGDKVAAGDTLCELDVETLRESVAQAKATLSSAQAKAYHTLRGAELALETDQFNQERNYDAELLTAEANVKNAETSVEQTLELLGIANADYRDLRQQYKDNKLDADSVLRAADESATRARHNYENAKKTLEDAKAKLKATEIAKKEAEVQSKRSISSAELSTDFSSDLLRIASQEKDLEKAVITAPVSGTVTALFAKEGAAAAGLLLVIEDTESLKVNTKVKEYDIENVHNGLPVEIKADGAGDVAYEGVVSLIAPTTVKGANGQTVSTTDAEFETEIEVVSTRTALRIGMNARIAIMTEEKQDVLAVSYDAVTTNQNGEQVVFVARKQEIPENYKGPELYTAEEIVVDTAMETDYFIEIFSGKLREGDLVIGNPVDITDGMTILIGEAGPDGVPVAANAGGQRGGPGGGVQMRVGG